MVEERNENFGLYCGLCDWCKRKRNCTMVLGTPKKILDQGLRPNECLVRSHNVIGNPHSWNSAPKKKILGQGLGSNKCHVGSHNIIGDPCLSYVW